MSIFKTKQAKREADGPWDDQEAANRGDRSDRAPHLRPDADGDTDDVRPGHKLAKAYDVGKFPVADPAAVLDGDAARPDDPAALPPPQSETARNALNNAARRTVCPSSCCCATSVI